MATRSQEQLRELMKSGEDSDLILSNGHKDFHVHREIVCPQSRVFREGCDRDVPKGHNPRITLDGCYDDVMEQMISFFYLQDYEDEEHRFPDTSTSVHFPKMCFHSGIFEDNVKTTLTLGNVGRSVVSNYAEYSGPYYIAPSSSLHLYNLGEEFDIPSLKAEAKERARRFIDDSWSTEIAALFVSKVCETPTPGDNELVDVIAQLIVKHADKPFDDNPEVLGQLEMHKNLQQAVVHRLLAEKLALDARVDISMERIQMYENRTRGSLGDQENTKKEIENAKKGIEKAHEEIENHEKDIKKYEQEMTTYKQNLEKMETIKKSVGVSVRKISKLKTTVKKYIGDRVMDEGNHRCWKCRFGIDATLLLDRQDIDILECGKCTEGAKWTPGEFSDDSERCY